MYWIVKTRFRTMIATLVALFGFPIVVAVYVSHHGEPGNRLAMVYLLTHLTIMLSFFLLVATADRHFEGHEADRLKFRLRAWMDGLSEDRKG